MEYRERRRILTYDWRITITYTKVVGACCRGRKPESPKSGDWKDAAPMSLAKNKPTTGWPK